VKAMLVVALTFVFAIVSAQAASAASCSSWRALCAKRSGSVNPAYLPQCDAKFNECLSSGCFTESANFGGVTHCGLVKK
jgi:hypothetical protein